MEEKLSNIIIYRLPESNKVTFEEIKREEFGHIIQILKTITNGKIMESDISKFYRLGKKVSL